MSVNFIEDLSAKIKASFFILMQTCVMLDEDDYPCFVDIKEKALKFAMDMPREADICSHRETLTKALRDLYTLKIYSRLAGEWVWHEVLLKESAVSKLEPMSGSQLFLMHIKVLSDKSGNEELNLEELNEWISYIPLRMTTARYYDYISDAVKRLPFYVNKELSNEFKRLFNPVGCLPADEEWMNGIKELLDELWEADTVIEEDIFRIKDEDISLKIIQLTVYISNLFDVLCASEILLKSGERVTGLFDDPEVKALHEDFRSFMQNPEMKSNFVERIGEATNNAMEKVMLDLPDGFDIDSLDDEARALYDEWLIVHKLYFDNGLSHFSSASKPIDKDEEDLPGFLAELKEYINECTQNMSSKRKRFLRQHFLFFLPYPYELEDYRDYFLETYEGLDYADKISLTFTLNFDANKFNQDKKTNSGLSREEKRVSNQHN